MGSEADARDPAAIEAATAMAYPRGDPRVQDILVIEQTEAGSDHENRAQEDGASTSTRSTALHRSAGTTHRAASRRRWLDAFKRASDVQILS
jgi:hypothetical protein